jgi:ABC-type polysaccharide/polyol phosphate transport system ATPase subunit
MRVRLGFAIASHLDAEVMLLDEVFAVGDAQFQQKCVGRIRDFQREGRTLLIVSHALPLIRDLSNRALWLHRGRLVEDDDATRVTEAYAVFMRRLAG